MKNNIIRVVYSLLFVPLLYSCVRENYENNSINDSESYSIKVRGVTESNILTKGLIDISEDKVYDLQLFVFSQSGNLLFFKDYDFTSKDYTEDKTSNNPEFVLEGLNIPPVNARVFALANFRNAPSEQDSSAKAIYRTIKRKVADNTFTLEDFQNLSIESTSLIRTNTSITTGVIMSGEYHSSQGGNGVRGYCVFGARKGLLDGEIRLERIDSKVTINIKVDDDLSNELSFTPTSMQIYNIPRYSWVDKHDADFYTVSADNDADAAHKEMFMQPQVFSNFLRNDLVFHETFYMSENRLAPKRSIGNNDKYQRDKQVKTGSDNTVINGIRIWENANNFSTYVKISGELHGSLTEDGTRRTFVSSVNYLVHLGNFDADINDYNTKRNHHYTYTIKIRGVDKIVNEVNTGDEDQPAASGIISINKPGNNSSYFLDAHHENIIIRFNINDINFNDLSDDETVLNRQLQNLINFNVFTPFNELYEDQSVARTDYTNTSWIRFSVNKQENGVYLNELRDYSSSETILFSIVDLAERIRLAVKHRKLGVDDNFFDTNGDLLVTCFVNENVYQEPREVGDRIFADKAARYERMSFDERMADSEYQDFLANTIGKIPTRLIGNPKLKSPYWKYYANSIPRKFYLIFISRESADRESVIIDPTVVIRQRSIQTILSTDRILDNDNELGQATIPALLTGSGFETIEEISEDRLKNVPGLGSRNNYTGNGSSLTDGRSNTLTDYRRRNNIISNRWDVFIDSKRNGHTTPDNVYYIALKQGNNTNLPIVQCLQRNRDLNRDGIIQENEIQWYLPSSDQYLSAMLANSAFTDPSAVFYTNEDKERLIQVFNSTRGVSEPPTVIFKTSTNGNYNSAWLNEFFSFGAHNYSDKITYRCARNLGDDNSVQSSFTILSHEKTSRIEKVVNRQRVVSDENITHDVINTQYLNKSALAESVRTEEYPRNHQVFDPIWKLGKNIMVSNRLVKCYFTNYNINNLSNRVPLANILRNNRGFYIKSDNSADNIIYIKPGQTPCAILNGTESDQFIVERNETTNPDFRDINFAHKMEGGYTNWRMPNAYEFGLLFQLKFLQKRGQEIYNNNGTMIDPGRSDGPNVLTITVDPGRKNPYVYSGGLVSRDLNGRDSFYVRCVRDVSPSELKYFKNKN